MAYSVEPSTAQTIDLSEDAKHVTHLETTYNEKFAATATVEKVIVFDKRKDINLQINSNGTDLWGIETTIHAGFGNDDILSADVPWVLLKDIASNTADLQSGGTGINAGLLAVRITTVELTGDFEIYADQQVQEVNNR